MRVRLLVGLVVLGLVAAGVVVLVAREEAPPVIFVHGMSGDARAVAAANGPFSLLLEAVAERYPRPGVCQREAQPTAAWDGSPCVFRYADDVAVGGTSTSSVRANAHKLASEVAEVAAAAGQPVVLVGFSMGGTIIRTFVSLWARDASELVRGVVILHGAVSGSWLLAGDAAVRDFLAGAPEPFDLIVDGLAVDLPASPAARDLTPGSDLMRRLATAPPPRDVAYTTVWGDIEVVVDMPGAEPFSLPPIGDVVILPGPDDPSAVPGLGGQRFSPGPGAIEIRHGDRIEVGLDELGRIAAACAIPLPPDCRAGVRTALDSPSAHWRVASSLDRIRVEDSPLGDGTLLDLVVEAIGREKGSAP